MPARHTYECDNGHEFELTLYSDSSAMCPECNSVNCEILWKATKSDYQIRQGFVDRL